MRWFDATFERQDGTNGVRWRRVGLPDAGSVGEQDAWLMEALTLLRDVQDDIEAFRERPRPQLTTTAPTT